MLLVAALAAAGWLVGGIVAGLAVALPAEEPLGRCPECRARYPLLALLAPRRGRLRCAACGQAVRDPWPLPELATAMAFGLLAWRFGWDRPLALYLPLVAVLVLLASIDVRHRLILDVVTYPSIAAVALVGLLTGSLPRAALGGLLAGGIYLGFYALGLLLYRSAPALGLGDVKLAALIGLGVGAPAAISAVLLSTAAGGLAALVLLLAGRSRTATMPYGPCLAIGALVTILIDPTVPV